MRVSGDVESGQGGHLVSGEAAQHLDGLTGAVPEEAAEPVWTAVGRRIARDGG
ncbi:hypothetical protein [Streptomyces viridosporus]|uniref:hypothetical protein n=1 Tax=Streptomyces viridosporus TaxID=67581 RepID=UPI001359A9B5|nr:hypothetical protein [Streptomyces viridosporus]